MRCRGGVRQRLIESVVRSPWFVVRGSLRFGTCAVLHYQYKKSQYEGAQT
jgi:hypothetical protein